MNTLENFGPLPLYLAILIQYMSVTYLAWKTFMSSNLQTQTERKKSIEKVDEDFFLHRSDKRQLTKKMQQWYWLQNSLKAKKTQSIFALSYQCVLAYSNSKLQNQSFLVSFCLFFSYFSSRNQPPPPIKVLQ